MSELDAIKSTLADLATRRNVSGGSALCHNAIEYFGGTMVPMLPYAPDVTTFRNQYYYNSVLNILFTKAGTNNFTKRSKTHQVWVPAKSKQVL